MSNISSLINIDNLDVKFESQCELIIVGAGIFGTSLAISLARKGRNVLLLERDLTKPDRIVGELLQPGGYQALKKLNLSDSLEGIDGIQVDGYVVYYKGSPVHIPYTKDSKGNRFVGKSFHHGEFVNKLRNIALKTENLKIVEATVNKLITNSKGDTVLGVTATSDNGSVSFGAKITVVADGCFSKFRKATIFSEPTTTSHFVGYVLKDCPLPYKYHGHVIITKNGPVLLYQIGTHDTRVLVDVAGKLPSASNGDLQTYMLEKVKSELPEPIQASFNLAVTEQKARVMPNSNLYPNPNLKLGLIVGGDAFNMRHPLTGGGMTVAFNDVLHITQLLTDPKNPNLDLNSIKVGLQLWLIDRKHSSSVVNVLALALYTLFAASDPTMKRLQQGCFKYFQLGGNCVDGPVSFLSAVDLNPFHLTYHFFAVCVYSQYIYTMEATTTLHRVINFFKSWTLFWVGANVLLPILFNEFFTICKLDILQTKFENIGLTTGLVIGLILTLFTINMKLILGGW